MSGDGVLLPAGDRLVGHSDAPLDAPDGDEFPFPTGLCPGGRLRMRQLLRVLEAGRVDPTLITTHTFNFDDMERAFEVSDQKLEDVIKPLIVF